MIFRILALSLVVVLSLTAVSACTKAESTASPTTAAATTPEPSSSAAAPPAAAASTAPPAGSAGSAIAVAEGEQSGVRAEVTELRRSSGGTVNLKFTLINDSSESVGFGYDFVEKNKGYGDIGGVHLIDQNAKKKYFVARDSEGNCVCSREQKDLPPGEKRNLWAKFPAPPPDVKTISIVIPRFSPLDDVPVSD